MSTCQITLRPEAEGGEITRVDVTYRLTGWAAEKGREMFRAQLNTVSVPGAEPMGLTVEDGDGPVPFAVRETNPYPILYRHWDAGRDLRGPVVIRYAVLPCERLSQGRHGPYFQLARENGGVSGPGLAFLVEVPEMQGDISLRWDLTGLPRGSRAVCTWGEGDVHLSGLLEILRQAYYAFGPVNSVTEGDFGFYWLTEPPFDVKELAGFTKNLFGVMQRFFHDDRAVYRVFMRHDLTESSGGTALARSYMFGWNDRQKVTVQEKQNLLAHEMVHNWPHLNDEPYGITTWYSEGTAEYYSIMIPLRAGLITPAQALFEIQKRTDAYYTNPTRRLSNMDAARVAWQDRRAQRLSYGRGIFFLANTDALIRKATAGKYSIDDVVLDILDQGRRGEPLGNEVFLAAVKRIGGIDVRDDWQRMCDGVPFAPLDGSFGGLFTVTETTAVEADTGRTVPSYAWALR
ncbi:MAG: hypothetical protein IJ662_08340 [Clostridia bacterium]|nr:hypothetical protein [Clostridia bacterium]